MWVMGKEARRVGTVLGQPYYNQDRKNKSHVNETTSRSRTSNDSDSVSQTSTGDPLSGGDGAVFNVL